MERQEVGDMDWKMIAIDDRIRDLATLLNNDTTIAARFDYRRIDDRNINFQEKASAHGLSCSLDLYGYLVSRSISEEQARNDIINKIELGRYDIAFLDYNLGPPDIPGGGEGFQRGLRLIRSLAEHFPEMPIIVISGLATFGHAQAPEVMNSCVEIYDKSNDLDEIVRIICENERALRILEKNVLLRVFRHKDPDKKREIPLKLRYDLKANRIEITGVLSPFNRTYFRSLAVLVSFTETSRGDLGYSCKNEVRKYGSLLRRSWQIDIDRMRARGVEVLSLSVILGKAVIFKTDFRWLADSGMKSRYLHYLKNFPYLDRQSLYASEALE
jgi:ActR/RegA family two-component response regulator